MTDEEMLQIQVANLERELREAREALVDKFALAITPEIVREWYRQGSTFDAAQVIWDMARNIVEGRK